MSASTESTASRLDRIESKLDQLASAMITLARAEEKLAGLKEDHLRSYDRTNRLSHKIDDLDKKVEDNARTVSTINKLFWIVLMAISGSIAAQLWM